MATDMIFGFHIGPFGIDGLRKTSTHDILAVDLLTNDVFCGSQDIAVNDVDHSDNPISNFVNALVCGISTEVCETFGFILWPIYPPVFSTGGYIGHKPSHGDDNRRHPCANQNTSPTDPD